MQSVASRRKNCLTMRSSNEWKEITASLPPGSYACTLTLRDGERMIDPWGEIGVRSMPVEFKVGEGES